MSTRRWNVRRGTSARSDVILIPRPFGGKQSCVCARKQPNRCTLISRTERDAIGSARALACGIYTAVEAPWLPNFASSNPRSPHSHTRSQARLSTAMAPSTVRAPKENVLSASNTSKAVPVQAVRQKPRHSLARAAAVHNAARRRRHITTARVVNVEASAASASMDPARVHVSFPATLARPIFKEIDSAALAAIDSELVGMPLEYIHEKLRAAGPRCVVLALCRPTLCSYFPQHARSSRNDEARTDDRAP